MDRSNDCYTGAIWSFIDDASLELSPSVSDFQFFPRTNVTKPKPIQYHVDLVQHVSVSDAKMNAKCTTDTYFTVVKDNVDGIFSGSL